MLTYVGCLEFMNLCWLMFTVGTHFLVWLLPLKIYCGSSSEIIQSPEWTLVWFSFNPLLTYDIYTCTFDPQGPTHLSSISYRVMITLSTIFSHTRPNTTSDLVGTLIRLLLVVKFGPLTHSWHLYLCHLPFDLVSEFVAILGTDTFFNIVQTITCSLSVCCPSPQLSDGVTLFFLFFLFFRVGVSISPVS